MRAIIIRFIVFLALIPAALAQGTFNVRSYGAKGDGSSSDTAAIQAALDACREAGGGQVRFPPGRYLSLQTNRVARLIRHP